MVAELATLAVIILAGGAEIIHAARIQRIATLAFGPRRRPAPWVYAAPVLRVLALGGLCWGLAALLFVVPKVHEAQALADNELRHVVLVLDVSPSMRLEDAGPTKQQSRMSRASDIMESFFKRVAFQQYRISVVAVYNGAKPVVVDTRDVEVVRNILNELPMHYAFPTGKTDIFSGLEIAAEVTRPWRPKSTTLILVSDGDTVPATGMPKMPPSISDVVVVGVGDPIKGKFIDGRQSRQDTSTLRQIALRLGGEYHNGNERHMSSATLAALTQATRKSALEQLTRREYALLACAVGSLVLALLPLLLHYFGTIWRPGVPLRPVARAKTGTAQPAGVSGEVRVGV